MLQTRAEWSHHQRYSIFDTDLSWLNTTDSFLVLDMFVQAFVILPDVDVHVADCLYLLLAYVLLLVINRYQVLQASIRV